MTPQELKASILQLAIQGKLVEQRHEEGTGAVLLEKIFAAKNMGENLTRRRGERGEGATLSPGKNSAHSAPPREEILDAPFDIPENWVWVCVGDLFQHNTGKALNSADTSGTPLEYITTSNVYWNRFDLGKLKAMRFTDAEVEKCTVQKGDLLVLEGGDIGRAAIWNYDFPMRIQNHIHRLRPYGEVCIEYFYYVFYYLKNAGGINGKGIGIKGLSANVLHSLPIPLPPLAEQKRIVAKIEELLPLIDRYEKAWGKLEDFNRRFPVDMQKSLLQMAIQGKLVEQRPDEGTGEELLEKILAAKDAKGAKDTGKSLTRRRGERGGGAALSPGKNSAPSAPPREEILDTPFDIPESWVWVRLGEVSDKITDGSHNPPPNTGSGYPVISAKNIKNGYISLENVDRFTDKTGFDKENPRTNITNGDIIMGIIGGSIGNIGIYTHDVQVIAQRSIAIIHSPIDNSYLAYVLKSPLVQDFLRATTAGSAQGGVYLGTLMSVRIPLPPLAEQKRIVAKLEELLPLCERLK